MKKLLLLVLCSALYLPFINAQGTHSGPRIGLSLSSINPEYDSLKFISRNEMGDITTQRYYVPGATRRGFIVGGMARFDIQYFYFEPELWYSYQESKYELLDMLNPANNKETTEAVHKMFVPLMFGALLRNKYVGVHAEAGLVPNIYLFSGGNYKRIETYEKTFNRAGLSYAVGAGIDIWNFVLDLRMERSFWELEEDLVIDDIRHEYRYHYMKYTITLGYAFTTGYEKIK